MKGGKGVGGASPCLKPPFHATPGHLRFEAKVAPPFPTGKEKLAAKLFASPLGNPSAPAPPFGGLQERQARLRPGFRDLEAPKGQGY